MFMFGVQEGPTPIPVPEIIDPSASESLDEPDMSTLDGGKREEHNFFEKLTGGEFDFKLPQLNLDKLCVSSNSVEGEETETAPADEAKSEAETEEKKLFTDEQVEEMKAKLKEGWAITAETVKKLSDTCKEKWAEYQQEKKTAESNEAEETEEPPMPTEVTPPMPTEVTPPMPTEVTIQQV